MFGARSKLGSDSHGAIMQLENLVGTGLVFRFGVDGNLTAGTAFGDSSFADFPDDFFNDDWVIIAMHGEGTGNVPTNITPGMSTRQIVTDFVSTGGVFTTASMGANWALGDSGYLVPIALLDSISGIGDPIVIQKAAGVTPTTAGAVLTGVAAGTVLIEELSVMKITGVEANGVTSLLLTSDDTVPLNQVLRKPDGDPIAAADLLVGVRYTVPINWQLASGKKLTVKTTGANGTAVYVWSVKCKAISAGASLATA